MDSPHRPQNRQAPDEFYCRTVFFGNFVSVKIVGWHFTRTIDYLKFLCKIAFDALIKKKPKKSLLTQHQKNCLSKNPASACYKPHLAQRPLTKVLRNAGIGLVGKVYFWLYSRYSRGIWRCTSRTTQGLETLAATLNNDITDNEKIRHLRNCN